MRAYLQLVRLPNVFTAMADIVLGFLLTHQRLEPLGQFALLLGASTALYWAGMVLNDFFDREQDARERPHRPIPSGRISLRNAGLLGQTLLASGVVLGGAASIVASDWRPGAIATALAATIVLYDGVAKRRPLGPATMGACRVLNVLLGMSLAEGPWSPAYWVVALGIGTYITGVTLFARTEARSSGRPQLALGVAIIVAGLALVASLPRWVRSDEWPPLDVPERWYLFWALLGLLIIWRPAWAILDPSPRHVQAAVRGCIFSLIIIDAGACTAAQDVIWSLAILALLIPTMTLGRWIYST